MFLWFSSFFSDPEVSRRIAELRELVCPLGLGCILQLSDTVLESFVQQSQCHPHSPFSMTRYVWMENMLRSLEIEDDDSICVSGHVVCLACFGTLCESS